MNRRSAIAGVVVIALLVATWIVSTSITKNENQKPKSVLLEVINVPGVCWEDHVGKRENYAGQFVRWQNINTKDITTHGFVNNGFSTERLMDEVQHPTAHHPPFMIEFMHIDIDTDQTKWQVHGISDHGENKQGYDSTCQFDVVKRGDTISEMPVMPTSIK